MNEFEFLAKVKALGDVIGDEALADEILRQAWDRQRLKNAQFDLQESRRRAGSTGGADQEITHRDGGFYWMGIALALLLFAIVSTLIGEAAAIERAFLVGQYAAGIFACFTSWREFKKGDAE